jgi:hypothetical protein
LFDDIWLDEGECCAKRLELEKDRACALGRWRYYLSPPLFDDICLDEGERCDKRLELEKDRACAQDH